MLWSRRMFPPTTSSYVPLEPAEMSLQRRWLNLPFRGCCRWLCGGMCRSPHCRRPRERGGSVARLSWCHARARQLQVNYLALWISYLRQQMVMEVSKGRLGEDLFPGRGQIARRILFGKPLPPKYYCDPHLDWITLVSIAAVITLPTEKREGVVIIRSRSQTRCVLLWIE